MTNSNNHHHIEPDDLESHIVEDRLGQRRYTLNTIVDAVIQQFVEETFGRQDILSDLDAPQAQREAIAEVADYVLARDYVSLTPSERRWLIQNAQQDLFRFGPLESYITDPAITEISISRHDEIYARHEFGPLQPIDVKFDHPRDLEQLLDRVLAPVGVQLSDDPFIEVGIYMANRPIRLSLVGPPMMPSYTGQIRLHRPEPLILADLQTLIPAAAASLLQKIVQSGYGLMIAGEVGVGKTTLLGALITHLSEDKSVHLVERTREIHGDLTGTTVERSPLIEETAVSFQDRLAAARHNKSDILLMDEIRGDEGAAFWAIIEQHKTRQHIAAFRGKTSATRLHSAFTMGIRKAYQDVPQQMIDERLLENFPFVIGLEHQHKDMPPSISFLGQWSQSENGISLIPLLENRDGVWQRNDVLPARNLD